MVGYLEPQQVNAGTQLTSDYHYLQGSISNNETFTYGTYEFGWYITPVTPIGDLTTKDISIGSRIGSIAGNYGVKNSAGKLIQSVKQYIVNEADKTYYNPVTDTTSNITNWSYDYSTRTYTITTDNSTTSTVTYGDEYVTINEGDTVYNVYYTVPVDQSTCEHVYSTDTVNPTCGEAGSKTSVCDNCGNTQTETLPATGDHSYTDPTVSEATCTVSGSSVSTCTVCGYVNKQILPAPGHAWTIKNQVQTTYDENGELLIEGYTIFECSVCGEQNKSTDGTAPPTGSTPDTGGSGSGDSGDSGGLLGGLLGSLGDLLGALVGGLLDMLVSLFTMIVDKLAVVVEVVMSLFQELPAMCSGFLDFLGALFSFIPEEMLTILTFGLVAVIAIAIIKAIRR